MWSGVADGPSSAGSSRRRALATSIVSVGYEGRDLEGFVDLLVRHQVVTVADVRLNAISRRVGFSKTRLSAALQARGITYMHLKSLGNPKDNRDRFRRGPLDEGVAIFNKVLSHVDAERAIEALVAKIDEGVVAVMCFEADHVRCHRDVVTSVLSARTSVSVQCL